MVYVYYVNCILSGVYGVSFMCLFIIVYYVLYMWWILNMLEGEEVGEESYRRGR